MTSTITKTIWFRAGHVVHNPHVHDFQLDITVTAPLDEDTSSPSYGMGADVLVLEGVLFGIAERIGHRMIVWSDESNEVRIKPCDWPKEICGPALEPMEWSVRPTGEHLVFWIAGQALVRLAEVLPNASLDAVTLHENERTAATVAGAVDIAKCERFPGPMKGQY